MIIQIATSCATKVLPHNYYDTIFKLTPVNALLILSDSLNSLNFRST